MPLIPVAIIGAFEALPRGSRVPFRQPLRVVVGPAITAQEVAALADEQLLNLVAERLQQCYHTAQTAEL